MHSQPKRKFASVQIPLHGKGTPLDRLVHWSEMASLNPTGFRTSSEKKNRRRPKLADPSKYGTNGRLLSHAEQLNQQIAA